MMLIEELARFPPAQRAAVQQALNSNCDPPVSRSASSNSPSLSDEFDAEDPAESESDNEDSGGQEEPADSDAERDPRLVVNIQMREMVSPQPPNPAVPAVSHSPSSSTSATEHPHHIRSNPIAVDEIDDTDDNLSHVEFTWIRSQPKTVFRQPLSFRN